MFSGISAFTIASILQTLALVGAQISTETCFSARDKRNSAQLSCGDGYISNLSVQSGTGLCLMKHGRCLGMTPSLLVSQFNCYWRNHCVINWPNEPIIYTEDGMKHRGCIGRLPTFMSVRYKCFKPTQPEGSGAFKVNEHKQQIIDICTHFTSEYSVNSNEAGIIRSHEHYPWDYPSTPRKCAVTFYQKEKMMLYVTVHNIDLSEADKLVIETENGTAHTKVATSGSYTISGQHATSFNFSVGSESNRGRGFLICYRFTSNTDSSVTNVCDSIMRYGEVTNTEAVGDDPFALRPPPEPTTAAPIPTKCLKKKSEKKRRKCIERASKQNSKRRNKGKGKRKRKGKGGRKRRHSGRKNV